MGDFDAQDRFAQAAVARLATATADGMPHLVPVVFAVCDGTIYTAIDGKPKTTPLLRRLANIAANPRVSMLVDHYCADWTQLWWVRADGLATLHDDGPELRLGHQLLRAKYPQYESVPLDGPVTSVAVHRWISWQAGS